jgi:cytoplasmic iron level regulating protein YaaA (DUF328/UPF0246 family)
MLTILGPAKTINTTAHGITDVSTEPRHLDRAEELVQVLRRFSLAQLKQLMQVSDQLAILTLERYVGWQKTHTADAAIQAILAFSGEVFNGLRARTLAEEDLLFAQEHVRLLSGLYGVLRPLDLILPYRLEMGTRLKQVRGGSLYAFWKDVIPAEIADLTGQQDVPVLVNLASGEYFKAIHPATFPHLVITPVFRESHGTGYRNVTVYAKKARGMMLRFIIRNRITQPEHLRAFDEEGYGYNPHLSDGKNWVFTR